MPPIVALPISLYVSGRRVVLVGAGRGATERLERLRAAEAEVVHVDPADYRPELVRSAFAVIANDDDDQLNRRVAADARAAGALAYAH
ncbi:MAG: NAD(P)-dependent oxidoreductase, partial [Deltaproteobacteria bacterium]|nr:NAD(P)-dependent oxidoreductase [Deltaproteobacteria bacterium]